MASEKYVQLVDKQRQYFKAVLDFQEARVRAWHACECVHGAGLWLTSGTPHARRKLPRNAARARSCRPSSPRCKQRMPPRRPRTLDAQKKHPQKTAFILETGPPHVPPSFFSLSLQCNAVNSYNYSVWWTASWSFTNRLSPTRLSPAPPAHIQTCCVPQKQRTKPRTKPRIKPRKKPR